MHLLQAAKLLLCHGRIAHMPHAFRAAQIDGDFQLILQTQCRPHKGLQPVCSPHLQADLRYSDCITHSMHGACST